MPLTEGRPLRLVVVGREGQVAFALRERGPDLQADVVAFGRPELDITRPSTLRLVRDARPDAIVNAAAYTAVDKAESEPERAYAVNADGAGAVAAVAASLGVPIIQLSTDYVFDGALGRPYREEDATGPLNSYGRSKLAGEHAVMRAAPNHVIVRTSWVYGPFGTNFVRTMLRLAGARSTVSVVADQRGCPTSAIDLADAIIEIARNLVGQPGRPELRGTYHIAGTGACTWFTFAQAIFAASDQRGGPSAQAAPIATSDYTTAARRPMNSRLDSSRIARCHGVTLPSWRASLGTCVARLLETARP